MNNTEIDDGTDHYLVDVVRYEESSHSVICNATAMDVISSLDGVMLAGRSGLAFVPFNNNNNSSSHSKTIVRYHESLYETTMVQSSTLDKYIAATITNTSCHVWDLNACNPLQLVYHPHHDNQQHRTVLQDIKWNLCQPNVIATGSTDGVIRGYDTRVRGSKNTVFKINAMATSLNNTSIAWDPHSEVRIACSISSDTTNPFEIYDIRKVVNSAVSPSIKCTTNTTIQWNPVVRDSILATTTVINEEDNNSSSNNNITSSVTVYSDLGATKKQVVTNSARTEACFTPDGKSVVVSAGSSSTTTGLVLYKDYEEASEITCSSTIENLIVNPKCWKLYKTNMSSTSFGCVSWNTADQTLLNYHKSECVLSHSSSLLVDIKSDFHYPKKAIVSAQEYGKSNVLLHSSTTTKEEGDTSLVSESVPVPEPPQSYSFDKTPCPAFSGGLFSGPNTLVIFNSSELLGNNIVFKSYEQLQRHFASTTSNTNTNNMSIDNEDTDNIMISDAGLPPTNSSISLTRSNSDHYFGFIDYSNDNDTMMIPDTTFVSNNTAFQNNVSSTTTTTTASYFDSLFLSSSSSHHLPINDPSHTIVSASSSSWLDDDTDTIDINTDSNTIDDDKMKTSSNNKVTLVDVSSIVNTHPSLNYSIAGKTSSNNNASVAIDFGLPNTSSMFTLLEYCNKMSDNTLKRVIVDKVIQSYCPRKDYVQVIGTVIASSASTSSNKNEKHGEEEIVSENGISLKRYFTSSSSKSLSSENSCNGSTLKAFSDLLYRWNELTKRTELKKAVKDSSGSKIQKTSDKVMTTRVMCAICQVPVRTVGIFCSNCGHGGHVEHMQLWFNNQDRTICPVRNCNCTKCH